VLGRLGCLFAGLPDATYGDADRAPVGGRPRRRRRAASGAALRGAGDGAFLLVYLRARAADATGRSGTLSTR
jgi:hypothetical protein